MSAKMTRIRLRGSRYGLMDWGEHSFEEMTRQMRAHAEALRTEADAILEAKDSDFDVAVVCGPYVQHFVRQVEPKKDDKA